jgi:hypothetical protein
MVELGRFISINRLLVAFTGSYSPIPIKIITNAESNAGPV